MEIDFEWKRCLDGYEIRGDKAYGIAIAPKSSDMEPYRPLELVSGEGKDYCPAMLRQLAAVDVVEKNLKLQEEAMVSFADSFGLLFHPTEPEPLESWEAAAGTARAMLKQYDKGHLGSVGEYFNNLKLGKIEVQLDCSTFPPRWSGTISDLHRAMWWQFVQAIIHGQDQEVCSWCGVWFAVGPDTGRRKRKSNVTRSYCCPNHQKRHVYASKKKEKKS